MKTAFIKKSWVEHILVEEENYVRLEQLAALIGCSLSGVKLGRTSRSSDLGRDARSLLAKRSIFTLVSTTGGVAKFVDDAKELAGNQSDIETVYIVTAGPHSERTLSQIEEAVREQLPVAAGVVLLGRLQIADAIVADDSLVDAFAELYGTELEAVRWSMRSDFRTEESRMYALQMSLSFFSEGDAQEIRTQCLRSLMMDALLDRASSVVEIQRRLSKTLRAPAFSSSTIQVALDGLVRLKFVEPSGPLNYSLTEGGKQYLKNLEKRKVRITMRGALAFRAAMEESLGKELTNSQWKRIWNDLNDGLMQLCNSRMDELAESLKALARVSVGGAADTEAKGGATADDGESSLSQVIQKVVKTNAVGVQRPELYQAIHDVFLPGNPGFDWVERAMSVWVAASSLGITPIVHSGLRQTFAGLRFVLDSDFVISYLCSREVDHAAAAAVVAFCRVHNITPVVPHAVAEEVARHAMKAHVDFEQQVRTLGRPRKYWEMEELHSAFTREFEWKRAEGRASIKQWGSFIRRYTGPYATDGDGKIVPNTSLMREILAGEGFSVLPSGHGETGFVDERNRLTRMFTEYRARFYGVDPFKATWEGKSRIDAELYLGLSRKVQDAQERGEEQHWILVSGSTYLRDPPESLREEFPIVPTVLSTSEASVLVSLFPETPVPIAGLRALLYDDDFYRSLQVLESGLLNVLRNSGVELPPARRGVLRAAQRDAIVAEARARGERIARIRAEMKRDPVLFGKIARVAADAAGIEDPVQRADALSQVEGLRRELYGAKG